MAGGARPDHGALISLPSSGSLQSEFATNNDRLVRASGFSGDGRSGAAPTTGLVRFMGGRIIDDQVYLFSPMLVHDAVHEVQKLPSAAFVMLSGNLTAGHIKRREQALPLVIL
jgi:hypothetical protein